MIIENLKQLDIQRVGDIDDGIRAGIDESSYPFIFELVSKQLYSNPIGSIIREIASNCFDSHIEAGVIDNPVIISKVYDKEDGYSIEFKDTGIGLSPERAYNIYMKWFSSTKRGDNTQIGGFGIGSKTPLAYADLFYITTIYNGLEYSYILHKGEEKPTLESLNGYNLELVDGKEINVPIGIETNAHNGTTIKINIYTREGINNYDRDNTGDIAKFRDELRYQLAYFDNVYFENWNITNDYDIYEGKYFKFRSDIQQSTTYIHLCIGKVRYSIDFNEVGIKRSYQNIPVAIKFEIGELQVAPSREAIRYNDKSKQLIKERVELAVEEILTIYDRQNPEVENLKDYIDLKKSATKITFNIEKKHTLNIWSHSGLNKNYIFKPIAKLNLKKTPDSLFFMWECVGNIVSNGTINSSYYNSRNNAYINDEFILDHSCVIMSRDDRSSLYTNIYIDKQVCEKVYIIRRKELDYKSITSMLDIKESKTIGKAKLIKEYINIVDNIVLSKCRLYSDLKPSDEWIAQYKRSIIENTAAYMRKREEKIFIRDIGKGGKGVDIKIHELQDRTGILIYGFKEDKIILNQIYDTLILNKKSLNRIRGHKNIEKAFKVIQISRGIEKNIIGPKKTIYWRDLFNKKFFRRIETSKEIHHKLDNLELYNISLRSKFLKDFSEDYKSVYNSIVDYNYGNMYFSIPYKYLTNNLIEDMLKPLNRFIEKHNIKLPLATCIDTNYISEEDTKELVEYFKYKGIRLRNEFYLKDNRQLEYEKNLKRILYLFKNPQNNLLTYNLNQENHDNQKDDSTN